MRTIGKLVAFGCLIAPWAQAQGDAGSDVALRTKAPAVEAAIREREQQTLGMRKEGIRLLEAFLRENGSSEASPSAEVGDALYKLAELYWEESKADYLVRMGRYQELVDACHKDRSRCPSVPKRSPSLDLSRSQALYQRIIKQYPHYPKIDTVIYLYAFSLRDAGKPEQAVQYFERITQEFPQSRFVADAWMAVGENRFYTQQSYGKALEAYEQVVRHRDSQLYDLALFKTAWCYWKLGDSNRAAQRFKDVLDLGKARQGRSRAEQKRAAELHDQALDYLVELFTEDDSKTAEDAYGFLAQIGGKENSEQVLRRLADTVFDQTRYERAAQAYGFLLRIDPQDVFAPDYQKRIVESYELMGDPSRAVAEMRKLATQYGPESAWAKANRDRPKALAHARTIAEEMIRTAAKSLHAEAQRNEKESHTVDRERYARVAEAYEFYLRQFPDARDGVELAYLRADILYFKLGKYEEAGAAYLAVGKSQPVSKMHKDALLQAMTAFEKVRRVPRGGAGKGKITESDRRFAEAADLYATLFPKDKNIVTVIYKNGQFFYDYGDYDEAVKRFGLIIERYPDDSNAGPAGDQILDALSRAQDYANIETWARRLKKTRAFSSRSEQERLDKLIVGSLMKGGDKAAAEGKYEAAAAIYWRVAKEYPNHSSAPLALNNAGAVLEKAKRPEEAVTAYEALGEKYPQSAQAADALLVAARIQESIAYYDRAAVFYERLAARFPSHPHAADALHNAAVLRQTLGQYDQAVAHYGNYARKYKNQPDARLVSFQVGMVCRERKDMRGAARAFGEFAAAYPNDPKALEALVHQAEAEIESGGDARAQGVLARALVLAKRRKRDREASYFAAQARYLQGELIFKEYERQKIAGSPRQLRKVLDTKAKLLDKAKTVYLDVLHYGSPEWATAALARIGQAYEGFAKSMRQAPVPKDLSAQEQQVYRDEMEKYVVVIEDKAIEAYKSGYAKALQLGVYNKYTQALRAALARLDDREYPTENEIRLGPRLGELSRNVDFIGEIRRDR